MAISVRDHRGGNWFWIHNVVITEYGKQLGPHGIAVYAALACHADKEQQTWVSQKALAEEVGGSRAQVQRELAKLKQLGLVEVEEQTNEHGQTSNIYVLLPVPDDEQPRISQRRGGLREMQGSVSERRPPLLPEAAMINKTHGTRPMEQDLSKDLSTEQNRSELNGRATSTGPGKARKRSTPTMPYLEAVVTDYSRELHDAEHTAANVTRATRLLQASALPEQEFVARLHEARNLTRRRGDIRKAAATDPALKNRMPYLFAVLEDLLGRDADASEAEADEGVASAGESPRPAWQPGASDRYTSGRYGRLVQR